MTDAVTIDRISPDVSFQLAEITNAAESHPVLQGHEPWLTLVNVYAILTKFQELFGLAKEVPSWAKFEPPAGYYKHPDKFFRNSHTSSNFTEEVIHDIEGLIDHCSDPLLTLCDTLRTINEWLEHAMSHRLRYAKG